MMLSRPEYKCKTMLTCKRDLLIPASCSTAMAGQQHCYSAPKIKANTSTFAHRPGVGSPCISYDTWREHSYSRGTRIVDHNETSHADIHQCAMRRSPWINKWINTVCQQPFGRCCPTNHPYHIIVWRSRRGQHGVALKRLKC